MGAIDLGSEAMFTDSHICKYPVLLAKHKFMLGSAALFLGMSLLCAPAHAGHHFGPQGFANHLNSIAVIQSHGRDDETVILRGRLTNFLHKSSYEFTDENGASIEVELDDDVDWSYVHKDQLIEIIGEVERNMFKLKIEAKDYRILETSAAALASQRGSYGEQQSLPDTRQMQQASLSPVSASPEQSVAASLAPASADSLVPTNLDVDTLAPNDLVPRKSSALSAILSEDNDSNTAAPAGSAQAPSPEAASAAAPSALEEKEQKPALVH